MPDEATQEMTTQDATGQEQTGPQETVAEQKARAMYGYKDPVRQSTTSAEADDSGGETDTDTGAAKREAPESKTETSGNKAETRERVKVGEPPKIEPFEKFDMKGLVGERKEWDEGTLKVFDALSEHVNRMNEFYAKQFAQQAQQSQAAMDAAEGVTREHFTQSVDRQIAEWGEPYEKLFGKGNADSLDRESNHWANRQTLVEAIDVLEAGREALGLPALPQAELSKQALASAFYEETKGIVRKEISKTLKEKSKGMLNRPTQREGAELGGEPGKTRAYNAAKKRLAELTT